MDWYTVENANTKTSSFFIRWIWILTGDLQLNCCHLASRRLSCDLHPHCFKSLNVHGCSYIIHRGEIGTIFIFGDLRKGST